MEDMGPFITTDTRDTEFVQSQRTKKKSEGEQECDGASL